MPIDNIDIFYKEVGTLIREIRNKQEISQETLASRLNLTRASVINLEKGRHKPGLHQLILIASILEVSYTQLIPQINYASEKAQKKKSMRIENVISDQNGLNKTAESVVKSFLSSI